MLNLVFPFFGIMGRNSRFGITGRIHVVSQFCLNSPCFPDGSARKNTKSQQWSRPTANSFISQDPLAVNSTDPKTLHASEI